MCSKIQTESSSEPIGTSLPCPHPPHTLTGGTPHTHPHTITEDTPLLHLPDGKLTFREVFPGNQMTRHCLLIPHDRYSILWELEITADRALAIFRPPFWRNHSSLLSKALFTCSLQQFFNQQNLMATQSQFLFLTLLSQYSFQFGCSFYTYRSVSRDDGHSQRSRYRSKERRRRRSTSPSPDRHSTHSHTRSRHSHSRRSLSRERGKRRHRRYSSDRNGRGSTSRKRGSDSQSSSDTSQGQRSSSGSESDSSRRRSKHSKHRHRSKKRRRRARDESESPSRSGEESLSRKRSRHKKKHRKKRHHKRDSDDELGTLVDQSVKSTPPDEDKGSSVSETVLVADQLKPCGEDEVRTISKECSSRGATELRSSACTEQVNTEALDTTQVTGTLDSTHQSEVTEQVQRSDLTAVQSSGMPDTPHAHTTLTVSTSPGKDHQSSTQTETGGCDSRAQDQSDMCTVDPGQETDRSVAHAAI